MGEKAKRKKKTPASLKKFTATNTGASPVDRSSRGLKNKSVRRSQMRKVRN